MSQTCLKHVRETNKETKQCPDPNTSENAISMFVDDRIDKQTNEQTKKRSNTDTKEKTNKQTNKQTYKQANKQTSKLKIKYPDSSKKENVISMIVCQCRNKQTNEQTHKGTNNHKNAQFAFSLVLGSGHFFVSS